MWTISLLFVSLANLLLRFKGLFLHSSSLIHKIRRFTRQLNVIRVQSNNKEAVNQLLSHLKLVYCAFAAERIHAEDSSSLLCREDKVHIAHATPRQRRFTTQGNCVENSIRDIEANFVGNPL